ncbi:hypothetical protein Tco_0144414 [Tanacetum coccineum]
MDITRAEQFALDDALVAPANRLKIGKSNLRLSLDLKSKEATLQVVYDVLKLTPFYKAFQISADICLKLTNQQFEELPFEEAILTFLRNLGHNGEIKMITDVNVNKLHQPWRSFAAVINKCLSGKNFVYQVENKNVKKSNEMYYPRFTKVLSRHDDTQLYGAILHNALTNDDIRNSESYKEYYAIASGAEPPKTKERVKKKQVGSDKTMTSPTTKGKRLKSSAKAAIPAKKKQPAKTSKAKRLTVLSEVDLTEEEQLKLAKKEISWKSSEEDDDDEVNESEDNDDD